MSTSCGNGCSSDPYEILGLPRGATPDQIKTAYRKLALRFHPDKQVTPEEKQRCSDIFTKIGNAYEILSDDRKREQYDRYGSMDINPQHYETYDPFSPGFFGFHDSFMNDGFSRSRRGGFTDPYEIFRQVFGNEFGGNPSYSRSSTSERDVFNDSFLGPSFGFGSSLFGGMMGSHMNMMQDLMNHSRGDRGGDLSDRTHYFSSSSSSIGGRGGGMAETVTTTTRVINGKRQTVTERIVRRPNGSIERSTETSGDKDFPSLSYHQQNNSGVQVDEQRRLTNMDKTKK